MRSNLLAAACFGALATGLAAPAYADAVALTLTRTNLTNLTDAAGLWQIETGTVAKGSVAAGQYEIERRVSTGGSDVQNTAAVRITFFLAPNRSGAPDTIVLEGTHSFQSGAFLGSVAAASPKYAFLRGADATAPSAGGSYTVTLAWTGAYGFVLP